MTALIVVFAAWLVGAAGQTPAPAQSPSTTASLDFETFRTRIQPIFLHKRQGLARCYICHSRGTGFRLQPLTPGSSSWTEAESQKNFEAARKFVVAGNPQSSRLLLMPLSKEAGGIAFHPGGKHWTSQSDPEWQSIAAWVRGQTSSVK